VEQLIANLAPARAYARRRTNLVNAKSTNIPPTTPPHPCWN